MAGIEQQGAESVDLKVDASAYALASVFGSVALPPGMQEYLKTAILDRATQIRDAAGDLVIDNRMSADDARARQAKKEADGDDNLSTLANIVQQQREEREREEWTRTKSTVAGVTMTGAEWAQLADRLRNDRELKDALISKFEKRGMSEADAEHLYERVADTAEIAAKPPSQRTEAETERFEKAKVDPAVQRGLKDASEWNSGFHNASPSEPENGAAKNSSAPAQPEMHVAMATGPAF